MSLGHLANRHSVLRHREEALKAMKEAVELYRPLAMAYPNACNSHLAGVLSNLAQQLSELGH